MFRKITLTTVWLALTGLMSLHAQTTLSAGDITIIGYNTDDADQVVFVPLVDLANGTVIYFTDNAWSGSALASNEGTHTYTASGTVTKGTVVTLTTSGMSLSNSGDQVLAYQGSSGSPTFIFAISTAGWITTGSTTTNTSYLPTGLTEGTNALGFTSEMDNGYYNLTGNSAAKSTILSRSTKQSNWTLTNTRVTTWPSWNFVVGGTDDEPSTLAAGDIAIIGYNFDNPDEFIFVTLRDLNPETSIKFTDNAWSGSALGSSEGTDTWTATTEVPRGTYITVTVTDMSLSTSGDQILAYQGTSGSPTFIYGLSTTPWLTTGSTSSTTSYMPSGLTSGTSAIAFSTEYDNGNYNTTSNTGEPAELLPNISNTANWSLNNTRISSFPAWSFYVILAGPTTLTAGDIAIIGYNTDNADEVVFVALADLGDNTEIKFTDNAWSGSSLGSSEGTDTWTGSTSYKKGSVITLTVSGMALSNTGDQVLVYQGSSGSPTFIYALSTTPWVTSGGTTSATTYLPTGLTDATTAIDFPTEYDNGNYNVTTNSGEKSTLLSGISNTSNWTLTNTRITSWPSWTFDLSNLATEPSAQPTSLSFSGNLSYQHGVSFTAASGSPAGYIVLRSTGSAPNTAPTDGTEYLTGDVIGNAKVAYVGSGTSFTQKGTAASTAYYYKVYSLNGSGTQVNYLQASPLSNSNTSAGSGVGSYYGSVSTGNSSFISDLQTVIRSPYTKITYDNYDETMMTDFAFRDTTGGQRVAECVYSSYLYMYTTPFTWWTDSPFSREHTWCWSWMPSYPSETGNEYSDQHHLFPTEQSNANGVRNNHPFGEVVTVTSTFMNGTYGEDANGNDVYEPRASQKGNSARALLYMAVRYNGLSSQDWTFDYLNNTTLTGLSEGPMDLAVLLDWHANDPVDNSEIARNDYVQSIQQNRNPFVDHPEWVDYIDFSDLTWISSPRLAGPREPVFSLTAWPNPMSDMGYAVITSPEESQGTLRVTDVTGRVVMDTEVNLRKGYNEINLMPASLNAGVYTITFESVGHTAATRFVKL